MLIAFSGDVLLMAAHIMMGPAERGMAGCHYVGVLWPVGWYPRLVEALLSIMIVHMEGSRWGPLGRANARGDVLLMAAHIMGPAETQS
jgi:hypothetical protein